jgi:hypothetical protein
MEYPNASLIDGALLSTEKVDTPGGDAIGGEKHGRIARFAVSLRDQLCKVCYAPIDEEPDRAHEINMPDHHRDCD